MAHMISTLNAVEAQALAREALPRAVGELLARIDEAIYEAASRGCYSVTANVGVIDGPILSEVLTRLEARNFDIGSRVDAICKGRLDVSWASGIDLPKGS